MRGRAVRGDVGGLIGGRFDTQAGARRPHLGLIQVGDPSGEDHLLIARPGQLQPAQHPALAGLLPGLVPRPQQTDAESAVRVVLGTEVALNGRFTLLEADLLDAGRRGRRGIRPVLAARVGAHVDAVGDFEAVLLSALDDGRRVGGVIRPVQAIARGGVGEGLVGRRRRAVRRGVGPERSPAADRQGGHHTGDQQRPQCGEQQRAARRGCVQRPEPAPAAVGFGPFIGTLE